MLVVSFTATNSSIWTNGARATIGSGVLYPPGASVMSNGLFIGSASDPLGNYKAQGDIELMRIYGQHPMDEGLMPVVFTNMLAKIQEWESGGGDGLLSGGDGGDELLDGGGGEESGLMLSASAVQGTNFLATITGGEDGVWYDFFRATNFVGNFRHELAMDMAWPGNKFWPVRTA